MDEDEAVAHCCDYGMRGIPCGRDRADDDDASDPSERLTAVGADVAFPAAVVDFAYGRQHGGAHVTIA